MPKRLTELLSEVLAKSQTEEGRRELLAERDRLEAEALQEAAQREKRPPEAPREAGKTAQEPPDGVQELPAVRPERRVDPILPVVQSVREAPEREAGRLAFGGIIDPRRDLPEAAQLPLLPAPEGPRVPLLELVDRNGVPTMAQGRGAPLDLAVYIGACILTPHRVRASRGRLVTTVRELRDFLFGPTWRPGPTGNRPGDWQRVREAALNASDLWLPLENGNLWRAVAVREIPPADYRPEYLDRQVIFDMELPAGAAHGPVIDRLELARLRLVSGPRFRAYIATHSVAWRAGITRRRHPRNRSVHLWSSDPGNYPILTAEDRRRLAFGSGDKKNRMRADQDAAWEDLPGTEILTRTATTPDGRRGWLVVPAAAAEAIRMREPQGGRDPVTRRDLVKAALCGDGRH